MRNSNTILASVQAFMDKMQDGDMRELVANLQVALEYKTEELRIYREKFEAETGKKQPDLTDDDRRRLARKASFLNSYFYPSLMGLGFLKLCWVAQNADRRQIQQRCTRTEKTRTTKRFSRRRGCNNQSGPGEPDLGLPASSNELGAPWNRSLVHDSETCHEQQRFFPAA